MALCLQQSAIQSERHCTKAARFRVAKILHAPGKLPADGLSRSCTRRSLTLRCVLQQPTSTERVPSFQPPTFPEAVSDLPVAVGGAANKDGWRVIPDIWGTLAEKLPDAVALKDPHRQDQPELTFKELHEAIVWFSEGLKSLGLAKGECVTLLAENSHRWFIADQGVMKCGACDAVRGTKSGDKELQYIVVHSDCVGLIVETEETLEKLRPLLEDEERCPLIKFIIVLWPVNEKRPVNGSPATITPEKTGSLRCPVLSFQSVLDEGRCRLHNTAHAKSGVPIREDDIATMVFTSGTTGEPKAVMLTHANLMHQIRAYSRVLPVMEGDRVLSLLPPWHMYERSCEYFVLSQGAELVYSGVKTFKEDLSKYPPDIFVAVPLVFDVLYNGVQRKLAAATAARAKIAQWLVAASLAFKDSLRKWRGLALPNIPSPALETPRKTGRSEAWTTRAMVDVIISGALALALFPLHLLAAKLVYSKVKAAIPIRKIAVSGGGSLAPHIDKFFEAVGITVLNGYGLTETSPVLAVRQPMHNVLGTVGTPIHETQIKVVDPETGATLPDGLRGIVKGKGPQIMKGYYKNPAATASAIDDEGWFNTGDLGWITPEVAYGPARNCGRQLVLEGRAKDTIVLANGENVEPSFVEEAVLCSPAISQIMVIGQDQRRLSALIVPSKDELDTMVLQRRPQDQPPASDAPGSQVEAAVREEERREVIQQELKKHLQAAGCGVNERIGHFALLPDPFTVENGMLTATMKMRRDVIYQKYEDACKRLLEA